ncbi:MAG: transcription termination factor Rho [Rhodothermaceae bacterium]|nr:transcription termination factor Rho [Rhodothermaceae bacterium]
MAEQPNESTNAESTNEAAKASVPESSADQHAQEEARPRRRSRTRTPRRDSEPVASSDDPALTEKAPDAEASADSSAARSSSNGQAPQATEESSGEGGGSRRGRRQNRGEGRDNRGGSRNDSRGENRNEGRGGSGKNRKDNTRNEGGGRRRKRDRRKKDQNENRNENSGHPGEPFEGMLELIGDKKFGFIRAVSTSLTKGDNDPFMPPPLIQKHNLRDGVILKGIIKPGRKGAWQVTRVDEVMGMDPDAWKETADFDDGMVIYPEEKINLITGPEDLSMRIVDLVAPLGKGQRALIVAPPRAGKTVMLKQMAAGVAKNHPEAKLIALLIDERPEEVTDFRRNTDCTVFASSNDHGEDNHIRVATLAFEYSRRLVEQGHDVVMLLDSLTRLGRTFNLWGGNSGRTMSGGLDARALVMPRKIFGAARNIENGGSLTIVATALVETGSRMDDVIFEEFKGTGNAEIVLDRELADKRIYPAITIRKSGTRNEERLMSDEQMRQRTMLFRVLNDRHPVEAMQALIKQVQRSPTNVHLLNELIPEQTY